MAVRRVLPITRLFAVASVWQRRRADSPFGRESLLSDSVTHPLPRNCGAVFCLKARVRNRL